MKEKNITKHMHGLKNNSNLYENTDFKILSFH